MTIEILNDLGHDNLLIVDHSFNVCCCNKLKERFIENNQQILPLKFMEMEICDSQSKTPFLALKENFFQNYLGAHIYIHCIKKLVTGYS